MGQYRQWLQYRHIDRQLQAQKEQLTATLSRLQESISDPNTSSLIANNSILQALTLYYTQNIPHPSEGRKRESGIQEQEPEIVSQVLFEHNRLPNFDKYDGTNRRETASPKQPTSIYEPLPPIPHKEMNPSAERGDAVPDEHAPTEPQVALPWWLQRAALSATQSDSLDAQSVRTNRLVQRWLERWGRTEEQDEQHEQHSTNGHHPPAQQERWSS